MPAPRHPFESLKGSSLLNGFLAFGSAQALTRIVRLGALLVVARRVSPEMFGSAALALSLFELIRVLANAGIGQRLIVATDEELPALCETAYRLFWYVCLGVAAAQLIVAAIVVAIFDLAEVGAMLSVLSLVYVIMPPGLIQIFLTMRAMRLGRVARVSAVQAISDSVFTLLLAIIWPSAWALVLPKLLAAPIWTLLARNSTTWRPDNSVVPAPWREFAIMGPSILATEIMSAVRQNADKLVVGAIFGTELLGIYYFAFNAGLGITQSFVSACNTIVFPHFANAGRQGAAREFRKAFLTGMVMLAPVVAAQAAFSPFYVPIVFGENWIPAVPYIALLSLAALPLYAGAIVGASLRVERRPEREAFLTACASIAALIGLIIGSAFGLTGACVGYGIALCLTFLPAAMRRLLSHAHAPIETSGGIT